MKIVKESKFPKNKTKIRANNVKKMTQKGWKRTDEAFKIGSHDYQNAKVYNPYNYTIQELRIDNKNKTFERGDFTLGIPDKKFKNRQAYEDLVDKLKDMGYTEIPSDYHSLLNKSRKGVKTESCSKRIEEGMRYIYEFVDGIQIVAESEDEALDKYEDIQKHRNMGEKRPFAVIDKIAQKYYDGRNVDKFFYFSDDELAELWAHCMYPFERIYDDEVFETIHSLGTKDEILEKADKEYDRLKQAFGK